MALRLDDAAGLTAGEVVHRKVSATPASATVAEVRAWFAQSTHRRMAVLADGERYAGSLTRADLDAAPDPEAAAATVAADGPAIAAGAPARDGYDAAVGTDARRVAVVAADGTLVGVLAVTEDLTSFCGVPDRSGTGTVADAH